MLKLNTTNRLIQIISQFNLLWFDLEHSFIKKYKFNK